MNTKDLSGIIRSKTEAKIRDDIKRAIDGLYSATRVSGCIPTITITGNHPDHGAIEIRARLSDIMNSTVEHVVKETLDSKTEAACRDFLQKVDGLQGQIDDLYHGVTQ